MAIYPNSLILEIEVSVFFKKKRKGIELTNWRGGTDSSRRRRKRKLDSPDEAMTRVRRGAGGRVRMNERAACG
jgi:hypothetical protein